MRVLALAKQVPQSEELLLEADGRMRREGIPSEMSAYCRRAVAKAVELARDNNGRSVVASLGPSQAEEILREALAWGADEAVLLSGPEFAGSDTLATARALASLARIEGPFDLILVGRSSLDAETGQVGPQIAQLLDLPFAAAVRKLELNPSHDSVRVECEQDDGWRISEVSLPAVLAVAERLCAPAKVPRTAWSKIPTSLVRRVSAADLGGNGPWGAQGSPTRVGASEGIETARRALVHRGTLEEQSDAAMEFLLKRNLFDKALSDTVNPQIVLDSSNAGGPIISVILEPDSDEISREMLGSALALTEELRGWIVAISIRRMDAKEIWAWGADEIVHVGGDPLEEDFAEAVAGWARQNEPVVVLAPATYWGREVASRAAASLGAGLIGDALELELASGRLVARKLACGGSQRVAILADSTIQMATIRPGVYTSDKRRLGEKEAIESSVTVQRRDRIRIATAWRDDNWQWLARADVVIGVGVGVSRDDYQQIHQLAGLLGAELGGTRKVTDLGWLPRSRQIGITGRSISPSLYVAIGLSGKANHMIGVRGAGTILAINKDRDAPVFDSCDFGIVGDWHRALSLLIEGISKERRASMADELYGVLGGQQDA